MVARTRRGIGVVLLAAAEMGGRQRFFHGRIGDIHTPGRVINIGEIHRQRADVGVRQGRETSVDDGSHWAGGHSMQGAHAATQVAEQLALRPWSRRGIGIRQSSRDPIIDHAARKSLSGLFGAERVARRVTTTAVAQAFGQIGSTIPFGTLGGVRLKAAVPEKQNLPALLQGTNIKREGDCVGLRRSSDRRPTKRVSPRAATACMRVRASDGPTNSKTSTGADNPLTGTGPIALTSIDPAAK